MQRPEQHEIDSAGQRLLRNTIEPLGWTVNKIENDYGRDFEVEVFDAHGSTGATFSVQLKSSRSPAYSAKHDFVLERLRDALAFALDLERASE